MRAFAALAGLALALATCEAITPDAARYEALARRIAALEGADACGATAPLALSRAPSWTYAGCDRDVVRNETRSVETCQNGTLTIYNASRASNLFDVKIANPTDAWHFVCGTSRPARIVR